MVRPNPFLTAARRIGAGVALCVLITSCQGRSPHALSPPSRLSPKPSEVVRSNTDRKRSTFLLGARGEFASGACVAFLPLGKKRRGVVFIDPGHGGPDPGATATAADGVALDEKTLTLAVARDLLSELRHNGYEVVMSRVDDGPVGRVGSGSLSSGLYTPDGLRADLQARVDCANVSHARLLLSIHFDAFGDPAVGGTQTDYDPDRPFSHASSHFAQLVQNSLVHSFAAHGWNVSDRGVVPDTDLAAPTLTALGAAYGHLLELGPRDRGLLDRASRMPGALAEPLFLTDPTDAAIIESRAGQETVAGALATAVDEYFHSGA